MTEKFDDVAVVIPCLNEESSIGIVVREFLSELPGAGVYVFDNGSTDATARIAMDAGARVRTVPRRGKGIAVRRMFADLDVAIYVMVDGDHTYRASSARQMVSEVRNGHDMVVARRVAHDTHAYRSGHTIGNRLLAGSVRVLFSADPGDLLSGYRAFSRRFVKSFPAHSNGFDIETELTVQALRLQAPTAHIDSAYGAREEGSVSKLRTYRDGWRIARTIGRLVIGERPLAVWSLFAGTCTVVSLAFGQSIYREYRDTGLVPRFPTAFIAGFLMMIAVVAVGIGLISDAIRVSRREQLTLAYLQRPAPDAEHPIATETTGTEGDPRD
jgi:glycosyltransferase involved in cell wall biosynthesis